MIDESHPAGANIRYLDQGAELIRRLDDAAYAGPSGGPYPGGVGAQFRHCLDFYDCFSRGLDSGRIDYARRERDPRLETDRRHAVGRIEAICADLRRLAPGDLARALEVRAEQTAPGTPEWSPSSAARELQFLVSHTIHHYALIAVLLSIRGHDVTSELPEFGIAPSTLEHWKDTGSFAR